MPEGKKEDVMMGSRSQYAFQVRDTRKRIEACEAIFQTAYPVKRRFQKAMHCLKHVSTFIFLAFFFSAGRVPASAQAPLSPGYVQQCNAVEDWNTTSISCTLNGVTAGDTIVVGTGGGPTTSVTSTAGTLSNVVTGNNVAAYILSNVPAGNITITASQSAYTHLQMSAIEYNNVAASPLDGSASGECNGYCTSVSTDTFTTTSSSDTLWAFCTAYGGYTITAGAAPVVWTARPTPNGSGLATFDEDGTTGSAGSYYGQCTGGLWIVSLALKSAGSGGSSPAATPTFSPGAGTYTSPQTVTISDATPGATIYYTTDGTMPTSSSAVYSAPITVSSSETVKAIATANGYSQSAVGAAAYSIGSLSVTNGTYEIQNLASGMVLDGGGVGTSKGTWVVQDNSSGGSNQQWTVTGLGNNTYEIVSVANGLSLDDYADATTNGTEVDVYTNSATQGNAGQIWYLTATSDGYYTLKSQDIVNAGVNSCIEPSGGSTASGAQIVINDGCDAPTNAQQWKFVPVTAAPPPVTNGTYEIKNLASGMVLDGGAAGTPAGTWVVQNTDTNGANQAWAVSSSGNAYTILGVANGLSLDDYGDLTANGSEIDSWTINGSSGQIWYLTPTSGGYFTIASQDMAQAGSGTCIEPSSGSTAPGAQIVITSGCNTPTGAEQWTFVPVSNLNTAPATPSFSPNAGTYNLQVQVAISSATPDATIYYTTDGTTPTTNSTMYSGPINVTTSETLKAIAVAAGYEQQSAVGSAAYTITNIAATPTFSPAEGTYNSPQSVTIESTPGATIYYTTDGTTPTTSSTVYTGSIEVSNSETIQAMAAAPGYTTSAVAWATYTISNGSAGSCGSMSVGDSQSGTASLNGITPFPATNLWNVNIANAPVDPINATAQANAEYAGLITRVNFGSSAGDGGIPFSIVDSSTTPLVPLNVTDDVHESDLVVAPYANNISIEGGQADCSGWPDNYSVDTHALVLDRHTCWLYETYPTYRCNGQYAVGIETIWDVANGGMRPWGWSSTDAAGLSVFAGLVRYDEAASGHINHAIRITVPHTKKTDNSLGYFVEPATHAAGNNDSTIPVEGMRLRLKSSFDISSYSPINQAILTAMKQYGLIVADNGSWPIRIIGATDSRWNDADLANLSGISSSNFEIVQMTPAYPGWLAGTAPTGSKPTINSFTASETQVMSGSPVTFNFNVSNDSYDYIDVIGPVRTTNGSGSVTIHPTATEQYTLYSTNQYGQTKATPIIVTVPGSTIATPTFNQPGGTYTGTIQVIITTSTYPFAQIYYTTDGSTPTTSSTPYSGPVTVSGSETIKAIAVVPGYSGTSAVGSATYTIN